MSRTLAIVCALSAAASANPPKTRTTKVAPKAAPAQVATAAPPRHDGAHARVAFALAGVLRPAREVVGRREEPLTPEEDTAKQIEKLLRGPLRYGVTGLFVADAKTGEPLFAVNADDALNPASNVKMISTAAALELLGPQFRYATRLLGPEPDPTGAIHGNVYLLGSWDPTLAATDLDDIAQALVARGVHSLDGDVVVGGDPTRDGIYRAVIPVDVHAGAPGEAAVATSATDLVTFKMTAKTARAAARPHLTFASETGHDDAGHVRVIVTVGGTIGKGGSMTFTLATKERTEVAAHALRAALRAHQIAVVGDVKIEELGDYISDTTVYGSLPIELGRHESAPLADIVLHVNKWSINWLADRVIQTAAALAHRTTPTMEVALDAMYDWLARHPHIVKDDVIVDTGSGLSYHTRITPHALVSVLRSAAGFVPDVDPLVARAWFDSLAIGGQDGTLGRRFRSPELRGKLHGKTGTLSTVIALSGVLDIDPARPLVFSIVTNGDTPLSKGYIRKAHEAVLGVICRYLTKTAKHIEAPPPPGDRGLAPEPLPEPTRGPTDDLDETAPDDPALDAETAGQPP